MMKRILILYAAIMCVAGCFQKKSTGLGPAETLETFYKAVTTGDFKAAGSYCNGIEMTDYIDALQTAWEKSGDDICAILPAIMTRIEVKTTDVTKNGQDRTVFYTLSSEDGIQKEKIATVGKIEGIWKITEITDRH